MRISARGRYGLAAMTLMAQSFEKSESMAVLGISEQLGISKVYLEQVYSLLRRAGLVISAKGAQGGYRLSKPPHLISVLDILQALEVSLFEKVDDTVQKMAPDIENAMRQTVFDALDHEVYEVLSGITLDQLALQAQRYRRGEGYMYYI